MVLREYLATSRAFVARHRMASAIAAPVTLGIAAVIAVSVATTTSPRTDDTVLTTSVTECRDMVTISVAGRGDTPREGTTAMLVDANGQPLPAALSGDHRSEWVDPVVNAPDGQVDPDSYAAVYIAYPADMASYEDAVNTGVANTRQVMQQIAAACPDTRFAIVGYSEGADVVRRVAMEIGNQEAEADGGYGIVDPADVVGVVILADAGRGLDEGPFPGAENPYSNPDGFDRAYQNGQNAAGGRGALPGTSGGFGALDGKVASFCSDGDLTCAAPENISLLQLVVNVGRQVNVDALEREGLTPATGQDVAVALGKIAMLAFSDISSQENWMASDETFLEVLLRVSDPAYKPGEHQPEPVADESIESEQMSPLAYLPQKVLNEIIGLIVTNQNTIPVIMSDPYQLTLGPNHAGHHFDYWEDSDPSTGKQLTSAEYAAAWLTHLAKQAQAGEPVNTKAKPQQEDVLAMQRAVEESKAKPTTTTRATTTSPSTTTSPTTRKDAATSTGQSTTTDSSTTTAPGTTTPSTTNGTTTTTPPTTTPSTTAPSSPATTTEPSSAAPAPEPARNSVASEGPAMVPAEPRVTTLAPSTTASQSTTTEPTTTTEQSTTTAPSDR